MYKSNCRNVKTNASIYDAKFLNFKICKSYLFMHCHISNNDCLVKDYKDLNKCNTSVGQKLIEIFNFKFWNFFAHSRLSLRKRLKNLVSDIFLTNSSIKVKKKKGGGENLRL